MQSAFLRLIVVVALYAYEAETSVPNQYSAIVTPIHVKVQDPLDIRRFDRDYTLPMAEYLIKNHAIYAQNARGYRAQFNSDNTGMYRKLTLNECSYAAILHDYKCHHNSSWEAMRAEAPLLIPTINYEALVPYADYAWACSRSIPTVVKKTEELREFHDFPVNAMLTSSPQFPQPNAIKHGKMSLRKRLELQKIIFGMTQKAPFVYPEYPKTRPDGLVDYPKYNNQFPICFMADMIAIRSKNIKKKTGEDVFIEDCRLIAAIIEPCKADFTTCQRLGVDFKIAAIGDMSPIHDFEFTHVDFIARIIGVDETEMRNIYKEMDLTQHWSTNRDVLKEKVHATAMRLQLTN